MDRFKFRAWNKDKKEMISVDSLTIGAMRYLTTLMQCIGQRDETRTEEYPKGKLIFEGDICEFDYQDDSDPIEIGEIVWSDEFVMFGYPQDDGITSIKKDWPIMTVIGNIYQDKELLNVI